MNNTELHTKLNRRYATKHFDTDKKIDPETFETLLESLRLSPSSFGLQPWKFIVVTDPEIRVELAGHCHGQPQLHSAPAVIVMCAKKTITHDYIDKRIQNVAENRGISVDQLQGYKDMLTGYTGVKTEEWIQNRNEKQVYLALGFLLQSCAVLGIDACPMEGFNGHEFDRILGLRSENEFHSVVIVPMGYRAVDDALAQVPKSRFPLEEVIVRI